MHTKYSLYIIPLFFNYSLYGSEKPAVISLYVRDVSAVHNITRECSLDSINPYAPMHKQVLQQRHTKIMQEWLKERRAEFAQLTILYNKCIKGYELAADPDDIYLQISNACNIGELTIKIGQRAGSLLIQAEILQMLDQVGQLHQLLHDKLMVFKRLTEEHIEEHIIDL